MSLATDAIYSTILKVHITLQWSKCSSSYKVVMSIQKLHHFCNTSSPDDGPKLGRKYLGNRELWKIYQSIPAEYYKINTVIWKDQQENM